MYTKFGLSALLESLFLFDFGSWVTNLKYGKPFNHVEDSCIKMNMKALATVTIKKNPSMFTFAIVFKLHQTSFQKILEKE